MSIDANKALVHRFLEVYGKQEEEERQFLALEWTEHLEGLAEGFALFSIPFPDLKFLIKDMIAEGNQVVVVLEWQATHTGRLQGIPPTGRVIRFEEVAIFGIVEDKIAAVKFIRDRLVMWQQLREAPPMFRHP